MGLHEYVKENFGYAMSLFRFPMGEFSEADLSLLQQLGYRSVFWSFAYRDWLVDEQPDPPAGNRNYRVQMPPGRHLSAARSFADQCTGSGTGD